MKTAVREFKIHFRILLEDVKFETMTVEIMISESFNILQKLNCKNVLKQ